MKIFLYLTMICFITLVASLPSDFCDDKAIGFILLPYPNDCSKFVVCWNSKTFELNCAPGTLFNAVISRCVHAINVECNTDSVSSTQPTSSASTSSTKSSTSKLTSTKPSSSTTSSTSTTSTTTKPSTLTSTKPSSSTTSSTSTTSTTTKPTTLTSTKPSSSTTSSTSTTSTKTEPSTSTSTAEPLPSTVSSTTQTTAEQSTSTTSSITSTNAVASTSSTSTTMTTISSTLTKLPPTTSSAPITTITATTIRIKDLCVGRQNGLYRHPKECSTYIQCYNNRAFLRPCAAGTLFDENISNCNFAHAVKCTTASQATSTSSGTSKETSIPTTVTYSSTSTSTDTSKETSIPTTVTYSSTSTSTETSKESSTSTTTKPSTMKPKGRCDNTRCALPSCSCYGAATPMNIAADQTPKMIMFTMDDNINLRNFQFYAQLLDGKLNPNGCNVTATYFVSGDYNDYKLTKKLFDKGHEIAVHTLTHKTPNSIWKRASKEFLVEEIIGMKKKLESHGIQNITGYRQPFLQTAGDTLFSVLKEYGFTYDSSLPSPVGQYVWPFTFDYNPYDGSTTATCLISPCPTLPYNGLWEVPMLSQVDDSSSCSMFDACHRYKSTVNEVYMFFKKNFDRHFSKTSAPFPMFGHASWVMHYTWQYREEGLIKFLKEMFSRDDVYFVSASQVIDWMKNPKELNMLNNKTGPFSCPLSQ